MKYKHNNAHRTLFLNSEWGVPRTPWRRCVLFTGLVVSGLLCIRAQAGDTLTLSTLMVKGTCTFTLPQDMNLGYAVPAEFTKNGGTVRTQTFGVMLSGCIGPTGGTERAGVVLTGTTLSGDPTVFSEDASGVAGFMFKEGYYSGGLSAFKAAGGTVTAGVPGQESLFQPGKLPVDGTVVPYTVGFVANGVPPAGKVRATVSFQMSYR